MEDKETVTQEKELSIRERIVIVQNELRAPKNKFNSYANFKYRSLEDILEAVKPLLKEQHLLMTISDSPVCINGRFWIKATINVHDFNNTFPSFQVCGYAREAESKVKMDDAQVTGMASTYARKYALNGLFLIDDNQDPDDLNPEEKGKEKKETKEPIRKGDEVLASRLRIKIKGAVLFEDLEKLKQEISDSGKILNKMQFASVVDEAKKKKEELKAKEISDEDLKNLDFTK